MEIKNIITNAIKGVVISIILTILLILGISLIMLFKDLTSKTFNVLWVIITCISIIFGGVYSAKENSEKGWLVGLIVAIIYFIIISIASIIFNDFSFGVFDFIRLIVALIIGALAGILGINI